MIKHNLTFSYVIHVSFHLRLPKIMCVCLVHQKRKRQIRNVAAVVYDSSLHPHINIFPSGETREARAREAKKFGMHGRYNLGYFLKSC